MSSVTRVLAIHAHPDDIEFQCAGTLALLRETGCAVTMVFRTGVQEVLWTFGRELLVEGLFEPTGDGDVHVWPCLSSDGSAVVIIELCSPDGELLVQASSRSVTTFVQSMLASVPDGQESSFVNFDDELAQILSA